MTKRTVFDFVGLYRALLKDIALYLPNDHREWERDMLSLTRLWSTRGQSVFTIDLPALGKRFDRALADGRLDLAGMNLSGSRYPRSKIPRLFWGLWSRCFDHDGCLLKNIDPNVVLFLRTLLYVGKNLEWECAPRYLYEATKDFFDVEAQLPPANPYWDADPMDYHEYYDDIHGGSVVEATVPSPLLDDSRGGLGDRERLADLLGSVQRSFDRIAGLIGLFSPGELSFRHGPGAVSDSRAGSYKYNFPNWGIRLDVIFPWDQYGSCSLTQLDLLGPSGYDIPFIEGKSDLIAVPKTQKGPRLIAKEPTCHQWIQQGLRDFLYTRVQETSLGQSLTFSDQNPSREFARRGSKSGLICTLDLSSASDRISCWLVQRAFRRNLPLLDAMNACRTRYLANAIDKKFPQLVKLRKFSTMGSALTFPVQSLVFLGVLLGIGKALHPSESWDSLHRQVRVFGDDLSFPNHWRKPVEDVLHVLYLKVNQTKTFSEGFFRESCGMDAWKGYDVTPPHVTMSPAESTPRSVASNVAVSNNFFTKGFWTAATWIQSTLTQRDILVVGPRSGVFGFASFSTGADPNKTKVRWNVHLQRWERRATVITAVARRTKQETAAALLQYFTEEPDPYVKYESGVTVAGVPSMRHVWAPVGSLGLVA